MSGTTVRPGPSRVVVGVDGSPSAHPGVMRTAAEAALRGSTPCLVQAADTDAPVPFLSEAEIVRSRRAGRELLDRTAEAVTERDPEPAVVKELSAGPAPGSPRRAAAPTGTIVVGHRGPGGFSSLRHAHCPVELIPRQGPGHGSTS
ncbi:universal stress protein [Streptomyces sp. JL2001]|uniref:universal stress protein n=1 Tax=Streptomyces sp. JL2001 TaxID=3342488 RepID=UPI003D805611